MKSKLALCVPHDLCGGRDKTRASVSPGNEAASVEERLIEVDISVTLDHYRKVRALILEDQFDRLFTETAKGRRP